MLEQAELSADGEYPYQFRRQLSAAIAGETACATPSW